jgi:hypothetical protein
MSHNLSHSGQCVECMLLHCVSFLCSVVFDMTSADSKRYQHTQQTDKAKAECTLAVLCGQASARRVLLM